MHLYKILQAQGVILKAFLEKRAVGKNVNVLNLGFHKRWFVLDKTALTYYDGKLSVIFYSEKVHRSIPTVLKTLYIIIRGLLSLINQSDAFYLCYQKDHQKLMGTSFIVVIKHLLVLIRNH